MGCACHRPPDRPPRGRHRLLVLGEPDRDDLYAAVSVAETRLGRPIQVVVREPDWWSTGTVAFHDAVTSSPVVELTRTDQDGGDRVVESARVPAV